MELEVERFGMWVGCGGVGRIVIFGLVENAGEVVRVAGSVWVPRGKGSCGGVGRMFVSLGLPNF